MSYLKLFIHKLIMACISVERECFETSLRPSVGRVRHAFVWKKCCLWLFIKTYVVVFHRYSSHLLVQILRHIAFVASDIQPFNYGVYWVRLHVCLESPIPYCVFTNRTCTRTWTVISYFVLKNMYSVKDVNIRDQIIIKPKKTVQGY